jgi:hypothetical protein
MKGQTILAILVGLLCVLSLVSTYVVFNNAPKVQTVEKPVLVGIPYNDTALRDEVAVIKAEVTKEADFKAVAVKLAEAEWNNKRDVYEALIDLGVTDLDYKSDIDKIVVRKTTVSSIDVDEQNAVVVQEVRVYYENSDGDDKRVTIEVTSIIEDGEVDEIEFDL